MSLKSVIGLIACAYLLVGTARADDGVFVLRDRGNKLVVERQAIEAGKKLEFTFGVDGFIGLILPVGPGGSGSIVQAAMGGVTTVQLRDGAILASTVVGGRTFEQPARSLHDLASQDIHVSAHTASGASVSVFIRGYQSIEPDAVGVTEDIFGGRIPLGKGDCVVYTNTFRARRELPPLSGELPVVFDGQHHRAVATLAGSGDKSAVIDLAAGVSLIAKGALPPGIELQPAQQIQYSTDGVRTLSSEVGGATGAAEPLGIATLPSVRIGNVELKDLEVLVLPALPSPKAGPIDLIIGLDVLARAPSVTMQYPKNGSAGSIVLGKHDTQSQNEISMPLSFLGSATYVSGSINGQEALFVVDNGSGLTVLDGKTAKAAGVTNDGGAAPIRGASGAEASVNTATAKSIVLAGRQLEDVPVMVGSLPIFQKTRATHNSAILGNSVLSRFEKVVVDFDAGRMILTK